MQCGPVTTGTRVTPSSRAARSNAVIQTPFGNTAFRRFPVGASPTRQPLQPEATGAGMEETKCLKPPDKRVTNW
jgi:hypothetical protein